MEEQSNTAGAMVKHWDWAGSKGLMTKATAASLSTSCRYVLGVESGWETLDVQTLDVEEYISRFNNLNMGKYKPQSLKTYGSRFKRAVTSYRDYLANPTGWSFSPRRARGRRSDPGESTKRRVTQPESESAPRSAPPGIAAHEYSFPIRKDFMAKLAIPRDVTTTEINRLVAWVRTLALDYEAPP